MPVTMQPRQDLIWAIAAQYMQQAGYSDIGSAIAAIRQANLGPNTANITDWTAPNAGARITVPYHGSTGFAIVNVAPSPVPLPSPTGGASFPHLVSVNTYASVGEAGTDRRFALVIAPQSVGASGIAALKAYNPAAKIICYIGTAYPTFGLHTWGPSGLAGGFKPDPQHFLATSGTTIPTWGIGTGTGTVTVTAAGPLATDTNNYNSFSGTWTNPGAAGPQNAASISIIGGHLHPYQAIQIVDGGSTEVAYLGFTVSGSGPYTTSFTTLASHGGSPSILGLEAFIIDSGASTELVLGNISGTTLTIAARGQYGSTAVTHSNGVIVRQCAYQFTDAPYFNASTSCPTVGGKQYKDWLCSYVASVFAAAPWDGVFMDTAVPSLYAGNFGNINTQNVDADNDNVGDGGDGASAKGGGWRDGMAALFSQLRSTLGATPIILSNNGYYDPSVDGRYVEGFAGLTTAGSSEFYSSGPINGSTSAVNKQWQAALAYLTALCPPGAARPVSVANADNAGTLPTNFTNSALLQKMRFNLACVLLTDANYGFYTSSSNQGGTLWMFDEYDGGQGGTLTADPGTTNPGTLTLATGMGARFNVGDIVRVPPNPTGLTSTNVNDEQMQITAIATDTLTVTRGVNGTPIVAHPIGTKVVTDAMLDAGRGWLGPALGAPTHILALGSNQLASNSDFESGSNTTLTGWTISGAGNTSYFGRSAAGEGYSGTYAAKATITTANPGSPFGTSLFQDTGLSTVLNNLYTIGVWARCDKSGGMNIMLGFYAGSTRRASQIIRLTQAWAYYTATFQSANAADNLRVQFNLNDALGTIWLDSVALYASDQGVWRRDFQNATVILNGTSASITTGATVPAAQGGGLVTALGGTFHKILSTGQNASNDGSAVTAVTVPSMDAIVLRKP